MGKEILVNVANRETRIAVLEDNQLVELRIEREEPVVGNIYKGRVENVLPGMDAAFVDIGLERNAFLYVADILPEYVESEEDASSDQDRGRRPIGSQPQTPRGNQPKPVEAEPAIGYGEEGVDYTTPVEGTDSAEDYTAFLGDPDLKEDDSADTDSELSLADDTDLDTPNVEAGDLSVEMTPTIPESDSPSNETERDAAEFTDDESSDFSSPISQIDEDDEIDEEADASIELEDHAVSDVDPLTESLQVAEEHAPDEEIANPSAEQRGIGQSKARPQQSRRPVSGGGRSGGRGGFRRHYSIAELVQTRQELMLQVVKGPRGTKGSRVSTRMSLPGRYLVLMPDANNLGVSRKIEEAKERDRLKSAVEKFRQQGYGIIVRTEAEGRHISELYQDYVMLTETWQKIWAKQKTTPAPGLIHRDQSLIYTIMRDAFGSDIDRLIIDSSEDFARAYEIIDRISPDLADRIHLYDGKKPMFEHFKIEDDIERLLRRKVWLKSGGYLVIDQTEALTSIDVNTGKFIGSTGLAETILTTNMEATFEIGRQLRLRDIGGMIVLDFIDMDSQRDKKLVTDALYKALKNDRSRTKIASISPLGLIEMTRKRTKETVDVALTDTCPYCHGIGRISSAETVSMQIEREINKMANDVSSEAILVIAHPDVVAQLIGAQGEDIERLERQVRRAIYVRAQSHFHMEKYEVEPGSMQRIEQQYPLPKRGTVVECAVQKSEISPTPWATAHIENGYQLEIANGGKFLGQNIRVRLLSVGRSHSIAEPAGGGQRPMPEQGGKDRQNRADRYRPAGAGVGRA